jgi:hypothetical protein
MANKTYLDYAQDDAIVDGDYILYWDLATGSMRRVSRSALIGNTKADLNNTQTFTAIQTFSAGINFGESTLKRYKEANDWGATVVLTADTPGTLAVTYTLRWADYDIVGRKCFYSFFLRLNAFTLGTATGNARISMPVLANVTNANRREGGNVYTQGVDLPGTPSSTGMYAVPGAQYSYIYCVQDNANVQLVPISAFAAGDDIGGNGWYFIAEANA